MSLKMSAGTLQLDNCRLIRCLISFIRSAGFNRSRYIGSAGKVQIKIILTYRSKIFIELTFEPVFLELYNKGEKGF